MVPDAASRRGCALVTGGSRGIGAAIARGLAADGWAVGINYRVAKEAADAVVAEIRFGGGQAVAIQADVSDPSAAEDLCHGVERELGRPLLVLVNNAARAEKRLWLQLDEEAWRAGIETNLSAPYRLTRCVLRSMSRHGWGRVINVTSAAVWRTTPGQSDYVASKAGLVGLTKAIAVEVAAQSVTVNAIAPGLIETDAAADVDPSLKAAIPARRMGTPEEVAACARFLASEEAGYVTGSVLTVDGGLTV